VLGDAGSIGSIADASNTSIIEPDSIFLLLKPWLLYNFWNVHALQDRLLSSTDFITTNTRQQTITTIQYRAATRISFPLARAKIQPARGPPLPYLTFLRGPALLSVLGFRSSPFRSFRSYGLASVRMLGVVVVDVLAGCARSCVHKTSEDAQTARLAMISVSNALIVSDLSFTQLAVEW
jgi:hypothetical protein